MPLIFSIKTDKILVRYSPDGGIEWINEKFENEKPVDIKRTFSVGKEDVVSRDENSITFKLGQLINEHYCIDKSILNTDFDVLIHQNANIHLKYFILERNISVFKRIEKLARQQVIIGGELENSISIEAFENLVATFPTSTELNHYASARVTNLISQYLDNVKDYGKLYENYLNKKKKFKVRQNNIAILKDYEFEKYNFLLEKLKLMLENSDGYSEKDWQNEIIEFILILYPKYIYCFDNVKIKDFTKKPFKNRFIDLMLVDANGSIDVIEIKKPFEEGVISKGKYRENYTPLKELSGGIMQIEKYLYHLSKWGHTGEEKITEACKDRLQENFSLKITNPKGFLILGRDKNFNEEQMFDFEIMKRKYSNIIDIMTYDDLINRLEQLLNKFSQHN